MWHAFSDDRSMQIVSERCMEELWKIFGVGSGESEGRRQVHLMQSYTSNQSH